MIYDKIFNISVILIVNFAFSFNYAIHRLQFFLERNRIFIAVEWLLNITREIRIVLSTGFGLHGMPVKLEYEYLPVSVMPEYLADDTGNSFHG
jgi:hypothetical protein